MDKLKFIIVGTGNRGFDTFAKKLVNFQNRWKKEFPERAEITAFVDTNLSRAAICAKELGMPELPMFRSIEEAQKAIPADWAIVTTPDFTHCDIVITALETGLNVVVDKPLATSVMECDRIIDTIKKTGRKVIVGHNARYHHNTLKAAQLVREGRIGKVLMIESAELLNYWHGGDYFHRWHSDFSKSAGLITHKCCHFFDLLNWILDDEAIEVSASGDRTFYVERPDLKHGTRCYECKIAKECPHYYDINAKKIFKPAEHEDGYIRDLCVFSDRHSICDHETVNIKFSKGTLANFSYVTFSPNEFWYFNLTGTKGRIEFGIDPTSKGYYFRITESDGKTKEFNSEKEGGEHGHDHADECLVADILGLPGSDPLQKALPEEAKKAVMISEMAAISVANGGRRVKASETGKSFPPAPYSRKNKKV